jgi:hypothetical protein
MREALVRAMEVAELVLHRERRKREVNVSMRVVGFLWFTVLWF